jgi:MFS family permease
LTLLALGHAVIHAQSALMPLVYTELTTEFALDAGDIGTFIAITTAVGGTMQLAYGFLTRYVARPALLAGGQLIFGASLVSAGLAQGIGQLLASISAARIGASPQHPVGNALLSDTFATERRGFAISAHISGGNVGTILVPIVGAGLLAAIGWEWTLVAFGIPAIVVGALIALAVREDHAAYRQAARDSGSVRGQIGEVLRRGDMRLILGASLVAAGGRGLDIVAPFMLLYLLGPLALPRETVNILYALLLVGAVVGPILAGSLSDRFGRRPLLLFFGLGFTLLTVPLLHALRDSFAELLLLVQCVGTIRSPPCLYAPAREPLRAA